MKINMISCDSTLNGKSIVLLRAFNPAIFLLLWFSSMKILIPEEAQSAGDRDITPDITPIIKLVFTLIKLKQLNTKYWVSII